MASSSTSSVSCFNCEGSGVCVVYPHVESVVNADVLTWITHPSLAFREIQCPYCVEPSDGLDLPVFFFFW